MEQENEPRITAKTTRIPLYLSENRIRVYLVDRLKDVKKFRDTLNDEDEYDTADAISVMPSGKSATFMMIFEREHITAGHIAHEAVHLKNQIFSSVGIKPEPMNDEPEAYFMHWLVDFIHSVWEKDKASAY